MCVRHTEINL